MGVAAIWAVGSHAAEGPKAGAVLIGVWDFKAVLSRLSFCDL